MSKRKLLRKIEKYNEESGFVVVLSKTENQIIAWHGDDFDSIMLEELISDIGEILNECGFEIDEDSMGGYYLISTVVDKINNKTKACVRINFKVRK